MKKLIYIDANIFLRFYDSNAKEFKKLLRTLLEIKEDIFITNQIVNEIDRNKLDVCLQSINGYNKLFSLGNITLPEHLDENKFALWNKETKKIHADFKKQRAELKKITSAILNDISHSSDEVSLGFTPIFNLSKEANIDIISKARYRKEIGNPPGKFNDPLGDQISWEQLLENLREIDSLFIVTNDQDYLTEYENSYYLNPFLTQELLEIRPKLKIRIFKKLSEALKAFNDPFGNKIKSLPTDKILTTISEEEEDLRIELRKTICPFCKSIYNYNAKSKVENTCPNCNYTHFVGSWAVPPF